MKWNTAWEKRLTGSESLTFEIEQHDIHVGFTGTQKGMTDAQTETVRSCLQGLGPGFLHHGWCIGADAQADEIARDLGYKIIGHPPIKTAKKADLPEPEIMCAPREYMARNDDIAIASSVVVATPKGFKEEKAYSGTWATIRRARKYSLFVIIVWPDGTASIEVGKDGCAN
jgi:hypothetical protein